MIVQQVRQWLPGDSTAGKAMITGLLYATHPKVHKFVHFTTDICAAVQFYCMCRLAKLNIYKLNTHTKCKLYIYIVFSPGAERIKNLVGSVPVRAAESRRPGTDFGPGT